MFDKRYQVSVTFFTVKNFLNREDAEYCRIRLNIVIYRLTDDITSYTLLILPNKIKYSYISIDWRYYIVYTVDDTHNNWHLFWNARWRVTKSLPLYNFQQSTKTFWGAHLARGCSPCAVRGTFEWKIKDEKSRLWSRHGRVLSTLHTAWEDRIWR